MYAAASQGQIYKHGLACVPGHWHLHYVVQVKPLTPCHWGISLSMATHRGGHQDSDQIKTHCFCFQLHQPQTRLQIQLDTVVASLAKRYFQCYWIYLCGDTRCRESEATANTNQCSLGTGRDRKSRQKSISQLVVWCVGLIVLCESMCCCCKLYKGGHHFIRLAPEL